MIVKWYRIKAGTSWTARHSDFDQRLVIDLGSIKNISLIAIQGRPHSSEYVTEFAISYGINDLEFSDYKESGGNLRVSRTFILKRGAGQQWNEMVFCTEQMVEFLL